MLFSRPSKHHTVPLQALVKYIIHVLQSMPNTAAQSH